jgi:hypothetical protein
MNNFQNPISLPVVDTNSQNPTVYNMENTIGMKKFSPSSPLDSSIDSEDEDAIVV